MSKVSANSLKFGNILVIKGELWRICKMPEHVKPGKGPAYIQVLMKHVKTGRKKNERFSSSDYLEKAFLDKIAVQYLYTQGDNIVLMKLGSYEQINAASSILEERVALLQDAMELKAHIFEEEIIELELPSTVEVEVAQTDPVVKGATVTSSYKKAILSCNLRVLVPPYIEPNERIIIKTDDLSFQERAKKK